MSSKMHRGPWRLSELKKIEKNGLKVFSCFHCGGGSSMGYKLAGYTVLGGVEIDPQMMALYRKNHKPDPRFSFLMGIKEFNQIPDDQLPEDLFGIDVLDGSPPCSSFSMSGKREKDWGKEKKFREGQAKQVLDDLFFHFIDTAKKLRPRVVVAENVKGMVLGNARWYAREVIRRFYEAGYGCQLYLLNASRMGVPQARERVFFIARRRDEGLPPIALRFDEPLISVGEALKGVKDDDKRWLTPETKKLWEQVAPGHSLAKAHPKGWRFNTYKADPDLPAKTLTASADGTIIHWAEPRRFTGRECVRIQTFPEDYDFLDQDAGYVCGMSVPPLMMERVASAVRDQLFAAVPAAAR